MAAATGIYKRILQILEKWPVDQSKSGRDLGPFLRNKIERAYTSNQFETNFKHWDSQYLALQRLIDNKSRDNYPRLLNSSATGLSAEECHIALSNDFLTELEEEEEPFYKRIFA